MMLFCCIIYARTSERFKDRFSYPFAVTAKRTLSSFKFLNISSTFSGVTITNSISFRVNGSGRGTIGAEGVTYSVSVIIFAGGATGVDEHAASDKIIINPRTFTIKGFAIFSAPFFFSQWCIRK